MTRNEAAAILAQSLLDAGYRLTHGSRSPWNGPDGYQATRADLRAHLIQTYRGDDREPFLDFLRPGGTHWPLVDQAARALIPARP